MEHLGWGPNVLSEATPDVRLSARKIVAAGMGPVAQYVVQCVSESANIQFTPFANNHNPGKVTVIALYQYLSVISTNKNPFIGCIIHYNPSEITSYNSLSHGHFTGS